MCVCIYVYNTYLYIIYVCRCVCVYIYTYMHKQCFRYVSMYFLSIIPLCILPLIFKGLQVFKGWGIRSGERGKGHRLETLTPLPLGRLTNFHVRSTIRKNNNNTFLPNYDTGSRTNKVKCLQNKNREEQSCMSPWNKKQCIQTRRQTLYFPDTTQRFPGRLDYET